MFGRKLSAAALDLASGRLDALLGARSAVDAAVKGRAVRITGPAFSRGLLGRGVGVGVRKGDAALRAELDAAIVAATLDGTIGRLSQRWFGFDVSVGLK